MVRVIDGDTIDIAGVRVRLEGIDAPEAGQTLQAPPGSAGGPAARAATAALTRLVDGRAVTCEPRGRDKYDRTLAVCFVGGQRHQRLDGAPGPCLGLRALLAEPT